MNKNIERKIRMATAAILVGGSALACDIGGGLNTAVNGYPTPVNSPTPDWQATGMAFGRQTLQATAEIQPTLAPVRVSATAPAVKPAVTVDSALHDAAVNYDKINHVGVADAESLIRALYKSMPDMPFVAPGTKGLVPHETQATALPAPLPSKDAANPSYFVQASMRGFYAVSGGYLFAKDMDSGKVLELPWQDRTTYNVYFVGATDKNKQVGLYDYAAGGTFGTGVQYAVGQDQQYPNRREIDKVWMADGMLSSVKRNGVEPGAKTIQVLVDLVSGKVTRFTFDNRTSVWTSEESALK